MIRNKKIGNGKIWIYGFLVLALVVCVSLVVAVSGYATTSNGQLSNDPLNANLSGSNDENSLIDHNVLSNNPELTTTNDVQAPVKDDQKTGTNVQYNTQNTQTVVCSPSYIQSPNTVSNVVQNNASDKSNIDKEQVTDIQLNQSINNTNTQNKDQCIEPNDTSSIYTPTPTSFLVAHTSRDDPELQEFWKEYDNYVAHPPQPDLGYQLSPKNYFYMVWKREHPEYKGDGPGGL